MSDTGPVRGEENLKLLWGCKNLVQVFGPRLWEWRRKLPVRAA